MIDKGLQFLAPVVIGARPCAGVSRCKSLTDIMAVFHTLSEFRTLSLREKGANRFYVFRDLIAERF